MNSYFKSSNLFYKPRALNQVPTLIYIYTIMITMLYSVLIHFLYINQLISDLFASRKAFLVANGLNRI
ncbi:hypothetical protein XELAEV_18015778mg [Xenopus laevis]|uniref:Uncharacterized protein n=1 Tax=Xenopus laevis TaxID=8355 RepID=A0A974HWQ4_XENLA|nr:hypothetical protein XELAEV_18015778mg [Xenopus laevis]